MKAPTRRRVPRAEREQQMLEVAEAVFAERGYQATSMDEIASRVGVTKPMLYEYFGSKDGLLAACLARSRQQLHDKTLAAVAAGGEPREVMLRAVRAFFEFVDDHAAAWAVLQSEAMLNAGPGAAGIEEIRRQQSDYTQALLGSMPGAAAGQAAGAAGARRGGHRGVRAGGRVAVRARRRRSARSRRPSW